jgi:type IV secretory pathway TrbF-like protein
MTIKLKKINFASLFSKQEKLSAQNESASFKKRSDNNFVPHSGAIENNPYLQSQQLYNDMYGSAEERYKKSRRFNQYLCGLVALSIFGIIYIGTQSKFIPYVVEIQNGQVIYTGVANNSNYDSLKPQLAIFFFQDFIKSARSVSIDGDIEQNNQKKAYALTKGVATTELDQFFKQRDPYVVVTKRTISVDVNYVNQLPNNAVEIGWTETSHDSQTGQILYQERYIGEFSFDWSSPSQNDYILQNNPFGFYITNISWTGVK